MWWIFAFALQLAILAPAIRQDERAGLWSWSKFVFLLSFAALECIIVTVPLRYVDVHGRYFVSVLVAVWTIAALNFVWMIILARRWTPPNGRTSLEACRDEQALEASKTVLRKQ